MGQSFLEMLLDRTVEKSNNLAVLIDDNEPTAC